MKNQNEKQNLIAPVNQINVHRGKGDCDEIRRAWVAVDGKLGKQVSLGNRVRYQVICGLRFCFDDYLQPYEKYCHGNCLSTSTEEAQFCALAVGLSEFVGLVSPGEVADLGHWQIGIVSTDAEFLAAIKHRIEQAKEEDHYYGSITDPIETLRDFNAVDLLQISSKDALVVENGQKFKLEWKNR